MKIHCPKIPWMVQIKHPGDWGTGIFKGLFRHAVKCLMGGNMTEQRELIHNFLLCQKLNLNDFILEITQTLLN